MNTELKTALARAKTEWAKLMAGVNDQELEHIARDQIMWNLIAGIDPDFAKQIAARESKEGYWYA